MIRSARCYAAGEAEGTALVLQEPLSLWGGIDIATGTIIDGSHPDRGASIARRILVMPSGRGSSSSASTLAEAIRRGTAPLGIVLGQADGILTVGSLVAQALYGLHCPIVVCAIDAIATGDHLQITAEAGGHAQVILPP